jgi:pimeloyl-ACP methyl ester carboxylesterase
MGFWAIFCRGWKCGAYGFLCGRNKRIIGLLLAKNSQLITIPNAGHLSNLEQPEQWNKAIIEMFGG